MAGSGTRLGRSGGDKGEGGKGTWVVDGESVFGTLRIGVEATGGGGAYSRPTLALLDAGEGEDA